jgi:hypothetical protein
LWANATYTLTAFEGGGNNTGGTTVDGINNNNQIVGFCTDLNAHVTNWIRNTNGSFTFLNLPVVRWQTASTSLQPWWDRTAPSRLCSPAVFTGSCPMSTAPRRPSSPSAFTTLNPVVSALAVTGFYSTDGTHSHGFLFNSGTASYTLIADPNVPNFVFSQLLGINDKGIVVGYYGTTNICQHGFLYDIATGQYTFLDDPNQAVINGVSVTQITGISDSGEITGF